ncbi:hypothetical protein PanWU01x14_126440, partial [Parasponia andersonii]
MVMSLPSISSIPQQKGVYVLVKVNPTTMEERLNLCKFSLIGRVILSVRVRDSNSICLGPKTSRCDICGIFVIGRNFKICGGSGGIGPSPSLISLGVRGLCPR